jgi:hypothetical protein
MMVRKVLDFLQAFRQTADDILYLPLTSLGVEADHLRVLHFVNEGEDTEDGVDVRDIGARFAPNVALVSVTPGQEARSAEYAAALGASLVIPHHYEASGNWPAADLDAFTNSFTFRKPIPQIERSSRTGNGLQPVA